MNIQESNLLIPFLVNKYQLKLILFFIILSSLFCNYEISATDEIDENKLSFNSSAKNSIDSTLISDFNFSNVTNITNNNLDSVYAQISAIDNTVYLVWQESVNDKLNKNNYDIYFKKSENNGNTFSKPINLSNNTGFSEHPQAAVSGSGLYVVWADDTAGNREVIFTKSSNGTDFEAQLNLSDSTDDSFNPEIAAFGATHPYDSR